MNINITKFNEVASAAKASINDKRWQNAIDKAVSGVTSDWWVIAELADSVAVTTETGQTYFSNGVCQRRAFELGQPCISIGRWQDCLLCAASGATKPRFPD
jgi:hypothetical protein